MLRIQVRSSWRPPPPPNPLGGEMVPLHARRPALLAVSLAVVLAIAGCGSSSSSSNAPGVTATSITFGSHQPLTGPAAPGYSEIAPASQAYFDYVNAHGGVFGRKIHLIYKDDAYNPTNTVNVVHQLVLQSRRVRDLRGPRHADPHQGRRLPEHLEGAGPVRGVRVPMLGQRHDPAVHVRVAAELHDRGQDSRSVHQAAFRGQEGRRALPGRRLRAGRPRRDPGRGAGRRHRRRSSPTKPASPRWGRRSRR